MKARWVAAAVLALATGFAGEAAAQQFPTRPIRILVSIPPGGAPDIAARLVAQRLTETVGWTVVIENKPGANGNLAGETVANAAPDGYSLILAGDSLIVINPHIYSKMPFDTLKDLAPVASIASNQFFLSVNPSLPVNTLPQLVDLARKSNPPLPYASGGNGSQHHLGIEMLKQRASIDLLHVPYRGGAPAGQATVAGDTKLVLAGASNAGLLRGGQLRGLATTGKQRSPLFPDMPTIGEFYPGYEVTIWLGLFAPAATPEPVLARLRQAVHEALSQPALVEKLNVTGAFQPLILPPAEFAALIREDHAKYGKIVQDVGAKAN